MTNLKEAKSAIKTIVLSLVNLILEASAYLGFMTIRSNEIKIGKKLFLNSSPKNSTWTDFPAIAKYYLIRKMPSQRGLELFAPFPMVLITPISGLRKVNSNDPWRAIFYSSTTVIGKMQVESRNYL